MRWFKRKRDEYRVPAQPWRGGDEWITVPFRFAEAARVSIHTIGTQEEVPAPIRWWIGQWLYHYNSQLVSYMREQYGPDIFPILDEITQSVMPKYDDDQSAAWEKWERQLREED